MANKVNICLVIHISASFLLLFTAFGSCQNIVSEAYTINNYGNLGFYTLCAIYLSCAVFSLLSSPIIAWLGPRRSIQVGSFCYLIWVVSGIFPVVLGSSETVKIIVYIIMLVAGVLIGFGASLLWVGQGKYVTDCCVTENKGLYFGLFWCIYMNSQILGNMISAFILKLFSQLVFFSIMSIFASLGFCSFLFLIKPIDQNIKQDLLEKSPQDSSDNDKSSTEEALIGINLNVNSDTEIKKSVISKDQANIKSTLKLFITLEMMKINALITVGGIVLGVSSGFLVKMISNTISNTDDKLSYSLYCMMVFGVGEISGGYIIGKIIDWTNNRTGVLFVQVSVILAFSSIVYTHSRNSYDAFWFITAFLFGICDSFVSTVSNSILGFEFMSDDGKRGVIEPFAINKFLHSLIACIIIFGESYIGSPGQRDEQMWYFIGCGVFSVISLISTLTFKFKKKKKIDESPF